MKKLLNLYFNQLLKDEKYTKFINKYFIGEDVSTWSSEKVINVYKYIRKNLYDLEIADYGRGKSMIKKFLRYAIFNDNISNDIIEFFTSINRTDYLIEFALNENLTKNILIKLSYCPNSEVQISLLDNKKVTSRFFSKNLVHLLKSNDKNLLSKIKEFAKKHNLPFIELTAMSISLNKK